MRSVLLVGKSNSYKNMLIMNINILFGDSILRIFNQLVEPRTIDKIELLFEMSIVIINWTLPKFWYEHIFQRLNRKDLIGRGQTVKRVQKNVST